MGLKKIFVNIFKFNLSKTNFSAVFCSTIFGPSNSPFADSVTVISPEPILVFSSIIFGRTSASISFILSSKHSSTDSFSNFLNSKIFFLSLSRFFLDILAFVVVEGVSELDFLYF
ncbi:unnamed protein product [Meloidogyne enterolobii]|uniref:Uncharacterized protein n=1 Tax=Meloidogyne enterolobii TaxID=390850 RepID=A0ACB0YJI8_MELEN